MAKLIHIQSSPRNSRSASQTVAEHFLARYREAHPSDIIETLDLWQTDLPEITGGALEAVYATTHGQELSPEGQKAWQDILRVVEHFQSADKYVVSLPMWNFSIPYKLKHYIDIIVRRGITYSFTPETGFKGLITGKPLVAIYARGGAYPPGSPTESYDQQSVYLKHIFGFIGFYDIQEIFVEPTMASPTAKDEAIAVANLKADEIAAKL